MKWARPGKEGKSGESTCAGGVAGRSRAFRWAESDAELKTLTYPGCQGTTTRSTPDPDKRPSEVGTGEAPRCSCGRCDWGMLSNSACRHFDAHKRRFAAVFRPE
jgi:hypothetical protein